MEQIPTEWVFFIEAHEQPKHHGIAGRKWYWKGIVDEPALGFHCEFLEGSSSGASALTMAVEKCKREIRNRFPTMKWDFVLAENLEIRTPSSKRLRKS